MKHLKYCKGCKKVFSAKLKVCPDDHGELLPVPEDIELKCNKCGSDKIEFIDPDYILNDGYRIKGSYTCKPCHEKVMQDVMENSNSKFLVINKDDDEFNLFDDSWEAEKYVKDMLEDYNREGDDGEDIESVLILKIYPLDRRSDLTTELFSSGNTNMVFYDDEWYKVKSATYPKYTYDSEVSVDLY